MGSRGSNSGKAPKGGYEGFQAQYKAREALRSQAKSALASIGANASMTKEQLLSTPGMLLAAQLEDNPDVWLADTPTAQLRGAIKHLKHNINLNAQTVSQGDKLKARMIGLEDGVTPSKYNSGLLSEMRETMREVSNGLEAIRNIEKALK